MATITLTVDDAKFAAFKAAFLRKFPVPLGDDGEPMMSENAWLKEWVRQQLQRAYAAGAQRLHEDQGGATIDPEIVT